MATQSTHPTVVGIGEILWDHFASHAQLGGCPTNYVTMVAALGVPAFLVSAVGADALGAAFFTEWEKRRLRATYVAAHTDNPTGIIDIAVDGHGIPTFALRTPPASDFLQWGNALEELAKRTDAVFFGTFGQWNPMARDTIDRFLMTVPTHCLRVCDLNCRPNRFSPELIRASLALASVVKLNEEELAIVANVCHLDGSTEGQLATLCERFQLALVALTRGPRGALFLTKDGERHEHPGYPVTVVDTVGAGDAFSAALTVGLLQHRPLAQINELANRIASYICTQPGATAPLPYDDRTHF